MPLLAPGTVLDNECVITPPPPAPALIAEPTVFPGLPPVPLNAVPAPVIVCDCVVVGFAPAKPLLPIVTVTPPPRPPITFPVPLAQSAVYQCPPPEPAPIPPSTAVSDGAFCAVVSVKAV